MNPFLCDFPTRMQAWKQCRQHMQSESDWLHKVDQCLQFWKQAPEQKTLLNWDNCAEWPDPWQLLYDNQYCASMHSLGVAYSLMLADPTTFHDLQLHLIWSKSHSLQRVVVHTHDVYLNVHWFDKLNVNNLNDCVVQDSWKWVDKKWESMRPK